MERLSAVAESQRRVSVRCTNEECDRHTAPMQRSARTWERKPCPACSAAVELCPGVDPKAVQEEPQRVDNTPRIAKQAPFALRGVRVPVDVYRWLRSDPKIKAEDAAAAALVEAHRREVKQ